MSVTVTVKFLRDLAANLEKTELEVQKLRKALGLDKPTPDPIKENAKKITKATHVINDLINLSKYKELRDKGFCEGMKFNVISKQDETKWLVCHVRSGRLGLIHPQLLSSNIENDF